MVQIPQPNISIQHHAWYTWAEIAIKHECLARRAHDAKDIYEYRPGLVAITSAAFALDALAGVARTLGIDASAKRRGGEVAERLKRGVMPQKVSAEWPLSIVDLFRERKDAVHFQEASEAPVWHEGLGSSVDPNVLRWGASGARVAVDLMLEVLAGWADHPSARVAEWAERHRDGVRALEILRNSCTGPESA